jgi:hypothetical protein
LTNIGLENMIRTQFQVSGCIRQFIRTHNSLSQKWQQGYLYENGSEEHWFSPKVIFVQTKQGGCLQGIRCRRTVLPDLQASCPRPQTTSFGVTRWG